MSDFKKSIELEELVRKASEVLRQLVQEPQSYDFFQAVRLLDQIQLTNRYAREGLKADSLVKPAGTGHITQAPSLLGKNTPSQWALQKFFGDTLRFESSASLQFPEGALTKISVPQDWFGDYTDHNDFTTDDEMVRLELSSFGLIGSTGKLPQHYTTLVVERSRRFRDQTFRHFLNIFTHHFTVRLYRSWVKYRGAVGYEYQKSAHSVGKRASNLVGESDPLTACIAAIIGIGTPGLADRLNVPDEVLYYHVGNLVSRPRTAESLKKMISDVFSVNAEIIPFVGNWLVLRKKDCTRLASQGNPHGRHAALGKSAIAGSRVWDSSSAFEVRLGPLRAEKFSRFLPGQPDLIAAGDLLRFAAGAQFSIKIRLVLKAAEVPPVQLFAQEPEVPLCPRLGWSTWLPGHAEFESDRDETSFQITS